MNEQCDGSSVSGFRVVKKLSTTARGAVKLARRYGNSLVCVRYRVDKDTKYRYTTVELVVDKAQIRPAKQAIVSVRASSFKSLATLGLWRASGAVWDPDAQVWRMPRPVAVALGLAGRIIKK